MLNQFKKKQFYKTNLKINQFIETNSKINQLFQISCQNQTGSCLYDRQRGQLHETALQRVNAHPPTGPRDLH